MHKSGTFCGLHLSTGYHFVERGSTCGNVQPITLLTETPNTWTGVDCIIMPRDLYDQEVDNMLIQWCKDMESDCANLPTGKESYFCTK